MNGALLPFTEKASVCEKLLSKEAIIRMPRIVYNGETQNKILRVRDAVMRQQIFFL